MVGRVVRVLMGFALASLAASFTLVLFVYAPSELASAPADLGRERMSEAGLFALIIAPHIAVSAALPALAGVIFAEARRVAGWMFYALAGIATGAAGFLVFHLSEAQVTILYYYALSAFLTAGLVGGLVYWMFSGQFVPRRASTGSALAPKPEPPASAPPSTVAGGA
jgi:hypothetical protein